MAVHSLKFILKSEFGAIAAIITLFFTAVTYRTANAESIAASLADYRKETSIVSVSGVTGTSFSGVALNRDAGQLFVVDNGNANIYVLSLNGTVERTITTQDLNDPEGICHLCDNTYFIASEGTGRVLRVEILSTGTGPLSVSASPSHLLGSNWGNTGIEGVSYCTANNMLYVVKETGPSELFRITLDKEQRFIESFDNDPFDISDRNGDAADIAALNDGNFIIVNQEENRLEGFGPTGDPLSTFDCDMSKPEGIAIDTSNGTIYMVGEPREFCVLKPTAVHTGTTPAARPDFSVSISPTTATGQPFEISFTLPASCRITIDCFSPAGEQLRIHCSVMTAGRHLLKPGIKNRSAGIYLFRITAGEFQRTVIHPLF
ncbi:MAG: SdiA-regulated domain-containing protein [Chitinispirillaceae bacterium]|nr:SdiA-regulated domain-containing protein [Chitinispirillaceae bacterium]